MILFIVVLILVFVSETLAPHKFVWNATYFQDDKEPFGCYVFDDVMASSTNDYSITAETFYQLYNNDSTAAPRAFLLMETSPHISETDVEYIFKLLENGNQIMLCAESFLSDLEDTLSFSTKTDYSYFFDIENYILNKKERDSIFVGRDTLQPEFTYQVYSQMYRSHLLTYKKYWKTAVQPATITDISIVQDEDEDDTYYDDCDTCEVEDDIYDDYCDTCAVIDDGDKTAYYNYLRCDSFQILAFDKERNPLALRLFWGKGELFLVSTPLMFTNYGILDGGNASYAFHLLSYLKNKPIVRLQSYGKYSQKSSSPLRFIITHSALRWATYSLIILLLLYMFFTARRRQRVIPPVNIPPNRSFAFMNLISNLSYQRHDNQEILNIKYTNFCAEIKKLTGISVEGTNTDKNDCQRLADKTGLETSYIEKFIHDISTYINYNSEMDDKELKQYCDGMNEILKLLKT
jgi:hypothetical protein